MKKYGIGVVLATLLFTFTYCSTQKKATTLTYTDLQGEWGVVEMNGRTLDPAVTNQSLLFDTDKNTISGNAGCNRISGRIEYLPSQKNIIRFMQLVSTRMACVDMSLEDELLKTIDNVVRFEYLNTGSPKQQVGLYGTDNTRLFVLQK